MHSVRTIGIVIMICLVSIFYRSWIPEGEDAMKTKINEIKIWSSHSFKAVIKIASLVGKR